jgi:hypothetical protein
MAKPVGAAAAIVALADDGANHEKQYQENEPLYYHFSHL